MGIPAEAVRQLAVKDLMRRDVLTVGADWSLDRLAEFLIQNNISGVPVTSTTGELVGVVSSTDIVRHDSMPVKDSQAHDPHEYYRHGLDGQLAREEFASFRVEPDTTVTVRDIMTPMIFEVSEDVPVQQVADTMIRGRIHRVFVTHQRKVVGVVTALDMLKVIRDL